MITAAALSLPADFMVQRATFIADHCDFAFLYLFETGGAGSAGSKAVNGYKLAIVVCVH